MLAVWMAVLSTVPLLASSRLLPTRTLTTGHEVFADVSPRVDTTFRISASSPFVLYVTPCGGAVHWQIFNNSISDDASALIAGEENDRRMAYYSHSPSYDNLLLVLRSDAHVTARLYMAYSQEEMDDQYPAMPLDTRLAHAVNTDGDAASVLITWKAAQRVRVQPARYRFCAVVSRQEAGSGACDEMGETESIHCVPASNNSMQIAKLRHARRYYITVFVRDALHGSTSSYPALELYVPERRGFTLSASRRREPRRKTGTEVSSLFDGHLETGAVRGHKGATLTYDFVMPANATNKRVLLVVHACDGYVRMNVYRNNRLLKRSESFSGYRRFLVVNVRSGQLRFQITNDDARPKQVRIWAGTDPLRSPYPILPEDTSVKVVSRQCGSVSLQWLRAPDDHVEYCLYQRRERANYLEELVSTSDNLCAGGLSSSSLVGCYAHRGRSSARMAGLIETSVGNLDPHATYRFDLLATPQQRAHAQPLPYRTVWARTKNTC